MKNQDRGTFYRKITPLILALGFIAFTSATIPAAADVVDPTNGLTLYTGVTASAPPLDLFEGSPDFLLDNSGLDAGSSLTLGASDSVVDGTDAPTMMDLENIAGGPVSILFDLGAVKNVTQELVWNFNQPGFLEFGAEDVQISAGLTPTSLGAPVSAVFTEAANSTGVPSQELNLNLGDVQYIQFTLEDAYATPAQQEAAGGDAAGLSEVHFEGDVPEPASCAMMGLGALLLIWRLRRGSAKFQV